MTDLLERFSELSRSYHRPSQQWRGTEGDAKRRLYALAQRELYTLAQAVCYLSNQPLQQELDETRRRIMKAIRDALSNDLIVRMGDHVFKVQKRQYHHWTDFEITPEISFDINMSGIMVPKELVRRLRALHRRQISAVLQLVGRI